MDESYYLRRININRQRLESIERKIYMKKKDLEDLYEFLKKHNEFISKLNEDFQRRKNRVNHVNIVESEVRVYSQLKEVMNNILTGKENQTIMHKKEEESRYIKKVIKDVEYEIHDLEIQRNSISNNISDLNYKLRKVRLKNE